MQTPPRNRNAETEEAANRQRFGGSLGRCLHIAETNIAPKFEQKGGDINSITKRTVGIFVSNERMFARSPEVGEENGVPQDGANRIAGSRLNAERKAGILPILGKIRD